MMATAENRNPSSKVRKSKSSIFDLFSKPKVERARGSREAATPVKAQQTLNRQSSTLSKPPPPPTYPPIPAQPFNDPSAPRSQLKSTKSTKSVKSVKSRKDDGDVRVAPPFEPPPLFQAYPQSIHHAILEAPKSSTSHSIQDLESEFGDAEVTPASMEKSISTQRVFERFKSRRKAKPLQALPSSTDNFGPTWAHKIYILATSGYLLQYSGTGTFDRLPEKMLKLGIHSAAFASDAIEGKHWVLQVVQEAKGGYVSISEQRPFLSKVGLQGVNARRFASKMLLIFESPEDMDKWMTSIRTEIDVLSGNALLKPFEPKKADVEEVVASQNRRYSGIVRQPSVRDESPTSPTKSVASSPTIVVSGRASSVTAVNSPTWSSSRSSRQQAPALLLPVRESLMFENRYGDGVVIGPALNSPSFFERLPSPSSSGFPSASQGFPRPPSIKSTASNMSIGGAAAQAVPTHHVPKLPGQHELPKIQCHTRRSSVESISSTSPSNSPDREQIEQVLLSRQPNPSHIHITRPLPLRETMSPESLGQGALDFPTFPVSPVDVTKETQRRLPLPRTASMEPISEASTPATTSIRTPAKPRAKPPPLTGPALSGTSTYSRALSLAPPTESLGTRPNLMATTSRPAKRNSVFSRPLPIATLPRASPPGSNRASVISETNRLSVTPSPTTSTGGLSPPLTSLLLYTPSGAPSQYFNLSSSSSPKSTSPRGFSSPNSRPSSVIVSRPQSLQFRTDGTPYSQPPSPRNQTSMADRRTSTLVPIIRPPISRPGLRGRRTNSGLTAFPSQPMHAPPSQPLPLPPSDRPAPVAVA